MTDKLSKAQRSENMRRIRSVDTKPEKTVRSILHRMGYRFRLFQKNLVGTPDIVLPKYKTVIFVNGCFWHRHKGCSRCTTPSENREYWLEKFHKNVERDKIVYEVLKEQDWNVLIIWECEIKPSKMAALQNKLIRELQNPP